MGLFLFRFCHVTLLQCRQNSISRLRFPRCIFAASIVQLGDKLTLADAVTCVVRHPSQPTCHTGDDNFLVEGSDSACVSDGDFKRSWLDNFCGDRENAFGRFHRLHLHRQRFNDGHLTGTTEFPHDAVKLLRSKAVEKDEVNRQQKENASEC